MSLHCVFWFLVKYQQIKSALIELDESKQTFAFALAFIPALLGIAYPLIIQTIGRLSDQYKSTSIAQRFRNETYHRWLYKLLIISTSSTILAILFNDLLPIAFISVVGLIIVFFSSLKLLLIYQSARDLFDYYHKDYKLEESYNRPFKHKERKNILEEMHYNWPSMNALMVHAISNGDIKLQDDIRIKFINQAIFFIKYIDQKEAEYVQFPPDVHNYIYEILAAYVRHRDLAYHQGFESLIGSGLFSDDFDSKTDNFTHSNTYYAIWKNLILMIEHDRYDKVLRYWGSAHQHCLHKFTEPNIRYKKDFSETERSLMLRQVIHKHRTAFLQFHFVLGAQVMHKRKFKELRQLWDYTQSQPPTYILVPQNMTDIFQYYFYFIDIGYGDKKFTIEYWFVDLRFDAMNGEVDVKTIARRYACLLFLRQWVRRPYYGIDPTDFPRLPKDLRDKTWWHEKIDGFKTIVERLLKDDDLKQGLGLSNITRENCNADQRLYPIDFLDKLKDKLKEDYDNTLKGSKPDQEKLNEINSNAIEVLREINKDFERISGKVIQESEREKSSEPYIRGRRHLMDKLSLLKNSGVSYLGYETEIGNRIKENYYVKASIVFHVNVADRYIVPNGKLFEAVDRLKLDPADHVVVAFNSDPYYLRQYENIKVEEAKGKENFRYKGIEFYCFTGAIQFANETLYILLKDDLPMIKQTDWKDIRIINPVAKKKWEQLKEIDSALKIYGNAYLLDDHREVVEDYVAKGYQEEDLDDKVEIVIDFMSAIWFKKGIKMISLTEGEILQEGGNLTNLDAIKPFVK